MLTTQLREIRGELKVNFDMANDRGLRSPFLIPGSEPLCSNFRVKGVAQPVPKEIKG